MSTFARVLMVGFVAGAGCTATSTVSALTPDWILAVDPTTPAGRVEPALLGQYDLSGALYDYPSNTAVKARMQAIGFSEWRVGVGRWEVSTRLLPTRTDGSSCAPLLANLPAIFQAPTNATDATLAAERDWFTDTGSPVTLADTQQDSRYALTYVRAAIDAATAFGAKPFVDLDLMPRALARSTTFSRTGSGPSAIVGLDDPCLGTFSNGVSNSPPADPAVFAAAARGLVQRVVEGSGAEPGRDALSWELWNEFELAYAWTGTANDYFDMAISTLVQLDAYRASSTVPKVRALRFGLGSFASPQTAATALQALDTTPLPNGAFTPFDFLSFHAYDNDPLVILAGIKTVSDARTAATHLSKVELVLSEWGPNLGNAPPAAGLDNALLVATVLARAPALGVTRTHHSLFFDFGPATDIPFTLLSHDGAPKPLYRAYELLHALVGEGAERLPVMGAENGSLSGGLGAVLVTRAADGTLRALVVNRDTVRHVVRLEVGGAPSTPRRVRVFDDPATTPTDATPTPVVEIPPRSIVLLER